EPAVHLTARSPERLFHLVLESHDGRAPGADSEEKHEPVSDIDTVLVDSLKALDPEWPIREADVGGPHPGDGGDVVGADRLLGFCEGVEHGVALVRSAHRGGIP